MVPEIKAARMIKKSTMLLKKKKKRIKGKKKKHAHDNPKIPVGTEWGGTKGMWGCLQGRNK